SPAFPSELSPGIELAGEGKFEEARKIFEKALKANGGDSLSEGSLWIIDDFDSGKIERECALSLFKGLRLIAANLPEQALEELLSAEKLDPGYSRTHNILGMVYAILGHAGDAERQFREAIRLQPRYAQAYFNLGSFYQSQGENSKALENYEKAASIEPSSEIYTDIAYICAEENRYKEAITYFHKSLKLKPGDADVYYNLGMAYFMSNQYLKSRENFIRAKAFYRKAGDKKGIADTDKFLDKFFELEAKWKTGN
ncbi:MAG: tetratricopeptide repeat protein, partial [Candidatus Omnitrophica bacterium]|nr:tetratricopeptide repeat protein [Candidatus Omnitrophota bacterium]